MSNEKIVSEIRNGISTTDNMQLLYENNLPLIKRRLKSYTAYEPTEDLLQESYFGLWGAAQRYETSENVRVMTYAQYWILQAVRKYLEKYGSIVRIPNHERQKMTHYRRATDQIRQELGREPTAAEVAAIKGVTVQEAEKLSRLCAGVASLDNPLLQKFDIIESRLYRGGSNNYQEHIFTSIVEHLAIKQVEAEERYKRHLREIEEMRRNRLVRNSEKPEKQK